MDTAFYIVFVLSVIVVSSITPLMLSRKRFKADWWDHIFPFVGVPVWFSMQAFDLGSRISRSNFIIETFIILIISITVPWLRFAITYMKSKSTPYILFILTLLPAAATIFLRLTMPLLPE
ncbi:MAG: hypothetical protein HY808_08210 [Nitrospirae bacterium]|nr:hypothetical protein [Nitrospirota bacterium]